MAKKGQRVVRRTSVPQAAGPQLLSLTVDDLCRLVRCLGVSEPSLARAEFASHTNDDNKDKDTGVDVSVTTSDGASELASCVNADNSSDDATEYNDGSDHTIPLVVISPGTPKTVCQDFKVRVGIRPNGDDTWRFNAKVTLYFTDGTTLFRGKSGLELSEGARSTSF